MAVKVTAVPLGVDGIAGVMLIELSNASVTDRVAADEVILSKVAVTLALPNAKPVATPVLLLIVATPVSADVQLAWLVMSAAVPSV